MTSTGRMVKIVLAVSLVWFVAGCNSMDRADSVRTMNKGLEAYKLGRTMEGVRLLKEAAQKDPTYADPPYFLGQLYHMKLEELDNAERYYREAIERAPDNPQIAYRLGMVLADQSKWDDSVAYLKQATEKDPEFAKAWFRLGIAYEMTGEYADAVDAFMKSIKANPRMRMDEEDPGGAAYHALGDLYIRYGFYDKALKVYQNAIQNNDIESRNLRPARLYTGQGVAQLKLERYDEAAASFRKALDIDSTQTPAIFNLAVAQMAMGKKDQAVKTFERFKSRADQARDGARIIAADGFIQQIKEAKEKEADK